MYHLRSRFLKSFSRHARSTGNLLLVFFVGVLAYCAPTTALYKDFTWSLYAQHHQVLAYCLIRDVAYLALQVGNYYLGKGAYDLVKAEKSYIRAFALSPHIHTAHYQLARVYFVEGRLAQALEQINTELQLDPGNMRSLYIRGLIEDAQGDFLAAESDFSRFITWAPGEWGGYNDLSYVLAEEGKYAQSEKVLIEGFKRVSHAQDVPWLWNSLGLAQLNQHKYTKASDSFAKALELSKTIPPAQWQRAYSANDPQAIPKSISTFQQAVEKNLYTAKIGDTMRE